MIFFNYFSGAREYYVFLQNGTRAMRGVVLDYLCSGPVCEEPLDYINKLSRIGTDNVRQLIGRSTQDLQLNF